MQMREDADLGREATGGQRYAPDLVGARYRDEQKALLLIDDDAVWTRDRVEQARQPAIRGQLPDAPRRIVHPGLALVGEIEIARRREDEIVHALEALACRRLQKGRNRAA